MDFDWKFTSQQWTGLAFSQEFQFIFTKEVRFTWLDYSVDTDLSQLVYTLQVWFILNPISVAAHLSFLYNSGNIVGRPVFEGNGAFLSSHEVKVFESENNNDNDC